MCRLGITGPGYCLMPIKWVATHNLIDLSISLSFTHSHSLSHYLSHLSSLSLSLSLDIYISVYICIYLYLYLPLYTSLSLSLSVYIYIYVYWIVYGWQWHIRYKNQQYITLDIWLERIYLICHYHSLCILYIVYILCHWNKPQIQHGCMYIYIYVEKK